MRRDVKDATVRLEHVLGAVAVVDVEVHDGHSREAPRERVRGPDGHVVEQAEAHRALRLGVMAGRAHEAEGPVEAALEHALDRIRDRSRGPQGGGVGARAGLGVGIEADRPPGGGGHRRDMRRGVHAEELLTRGVARKGQLQPLLETRFADALAQRLQPLRPLGMARAGIVLAEDRVVVEPDAHGAIIRRREGGGQARVTVTPRRS